MTPSHVSQHHRAGHTPRKGRHHRAMAWAVYLLRGRAGADDMRGGRTSCPAHPPPPSPSQPSSESQAAGGGLGVCCARTAAGTPETRPAVGEGGGGDGRERRGVPIPAGLLLIEPAPGNTPAEPTHSVCWNILVGVDRTPETAASAAGSTWTFAWPRRADRTWAREARTRIRPASWLRADPGRRTFPRPPSESAAPASTRGYHASTGPAPGFGTGTRARPSSALSGSAGWASRTRMSTHSASSPAAALRAAPSSPSATGRAKTKTSSSRGSQDASPAAARDRYSATPSRAVQYTCGGPRSEPPPTARAWPEHCSTVTTATAAADPDEVAAAATPMCSPLSVGAREAAEAIEDPITAEV
mmetsp:Transcript_32664/g.68277  ORF Transcript_32664/g.68277 Transcript_32664/m.68277 type:complete len:358 (+) Transcript_32664:101-1174(+)